MVEGPCNEHYLKKPKKGQEPVVHLANNRTLIRKLVPASTVSQFLQHQEVPALSDDLFASDDLGNYNFNSEDRFDVTTLLSPRKRVDSPTKHRHRATQIAQWHTWQEDIIPALIPVFIRLWHTTRCLRHSDALPCPTTTTPCECRNPVVCQISVVQFTKIEDIEIDVCSCTPAAQQLLAAGLFPCAPLRPTLAVDIRVLDLVMKLFVWITPNNMTWTGTLESFLQGLGFTLQHKGSLRRLFGSMLEWYTHLRNQVEQHFNQVLEQVRAEHWPHNKLESSEAEDDPSPTTTQTNMRPVAGARGRSMRRSETGSPVTSPMPTMKTSKKRAREPTPEPVKSNPFKAPRPRARPSEYLRQRCPACFGRLKHNPSVTYACPLPFDVPKLMHHPRADVFVCIDACFTQKRNKGAPDPPKMHPSTHFILEAVASKMEEYVDGVRKPKVAKRAQKAAVVEAEDEEDADEDCYEHPQLLVPRSVLDECEASFTAADERREKASIKFYDDTALMALLCRHDCVLWLVNMHSAGEKQFNVLLLLETLFQHLPLNIKVGLLYDIACQLERSALKWGFLAQFLHWLAFAVAVFHTFGHDWACQLIYHPRKRVGFGFTNGEGCKRFWHAIAHLIAHLQISSYHHWLYTLDMQVKHADEANLFKLAEWNYRRKLHSPTKHVAGQAVLRECGHSIKLLRKQWEDQVKAQTKPLARRSKTAGQKAVNAVLALWEALTIRKDQQAAAEAEVLDAIQEGDDERHARWTAVLEGARKQVQKTKTQLKTKEFALGVDGRNRLTNMQHSKYFHLRANAYALKHRLHDLLHVCKFERDRVEQTLIDHVENKLRIHTDQALQQWEPKIVRTNREYNDLVTKITKEIRQGQAPRGSIALDRILGKALFQLDVDDVIWQDIGLTDQEDATIPLWLSSDTVRSGIKAMLEVDRADEEDVFLAKECAAMKSWFTEEWTIINAAMRDADTEAERYQFHLLWECLIRLCATWQKHWPETAEEDVDWGPSQGELLACVIDSRTAGRGEDGYEVRGEEDSDGEVEDYVVLDALETADAYRDAYDEDGTDSEMDSEYDSQ
ncbi:hypothetical protein DFH07DRAFT_744528 [Mycena maculata]|uniref:CxC2-like cysteine cluster KDZ transposase-associated domain-containing protein n=1 Tax=Mycena maculata TaxID=230809 RepID=A0AAD7NB22_9AGAR|nr:hypothetical protein DFH07DRAFT_744528 [Mycena maculata]